LVSYDEDEEYKHDSSGIDAEGDSRKHQNTSKVFLKLLESQNAHSSGMHHGLDGTGGSNSFVKVRKSLFN
jgi:hypothetical protein